MDKSTKMWMKSTAVLFAVSAVCLFLILTKSIPFFIGVRCWVIAIVCYVFYAPFIMLEGFSEGAQKGIDNLASSREKHKKKWGIVEDD